MKKPISDFYPLKRCSKCKEITSIDNYYVDRYKTDHLTSQCKSCHSAKYRRNAKERTIQIRANKLRKFGASEKLLKEAALKQGNKCAICQEQFEKIPHADHCHKAMKFRGLLCHGCNIGLGCFKDNILIMSKAIRYLKKHAN